MVSMGESAIHESTAKKILHKLNPAHHQDKHERTEGPHDTATVHQDVGDDAVKPLVEKTNHVHSDTSHPTVEAYAL